jgi:hypothetical protein
MASKLKLTELLYPTSTTAAITINSDDSVTIPTQSTTNLAYTGTLTGGTGVVNLGSGQFYKDASGNVGIGTSSPASNAGFGGLTLNGTSGSLFDLRVANTLTFRVGTTSTENLLQGISNVPMTFYTNNSERMRIDSSGNVGIGTASPLARLNAQADNNNSDLGQLIVSGATNSNKRLSLGFNTTSNYGFVQSIIAGDNYYPLVLQPTAGNVLVGTTTDTIGTLVVKAKNTGYGGIQVVVAGGSDYWTQNVDTVSGYTWGKNGADFWHAGRSGSNNCVSVNGSWVNSSDEKLKKNISTLTGALEKVISMRGVEFDRKNNDAHEIGLIAQEVLLVYPEAVEQNEDSLGLNYGSLIAPLIEAIKEQQALITQLQADVATLKGAA